MLYQKSKFNCVPETNQVSIKSNFPAREAAARAMLIKSTHSDPTGNKLD